ncbi:MAG: S-methyl-5-thioribose-1-phosphate isomerase, partial [Bacillota bacterium]
MNAYRSIEWRGNAVRLLDQRLLPHKVVYVDYADYRDVATAIRDMVVRGAPAIGAAAAYGLALAALGSSATTVEALRAVLEEAGRILRATRPTAVNLFWAIDRVMQRVADPTISDTEQARQAVIAEAHAIAEEDIRTNCSIGLNGLSLIP